MRMSRLSAFQPSLGPNTNKDRNTLTVTHPNLQSVTLCGGLKCWNRSESDRSLSRCLTRRWSHAGTTGTVRISDVPDEADRTDKRYLTIITSSELLPISCLISLSREANRENHVSPPSDTSRKLPSHSRSTDPLQVRRAGTLTHRLLF